MFTWNVETGDWTILDYGELAELPPSKLRNPGGSSSHGSVTGGSGGGGAGASGSSASELTRIVRKMAREMAPSMRRTDRPDEDWAGLWTLDSCVERSKEVLRDQHNSIEFYRFAVGGEEEEEEEDDDDHRAPPFMGDDDSLESSDFE